MKNVLSIAMIAFTLIFSMEAKAQKMPGLDKSPMDAASYPSSYKISDKAFRVIYSRPQLKGRAIADLAPNGKVWRTGANEATEITFYKDVTFGGGAVKAGTYALYAIPGDTEWTIILNSKLNQWGSYSYDETADIARIKVTAKSDSKSIEAFSMLFDEVEGSVNMIMAWGTVRVAVPISIPM